VFNLAAQTPMSSSEDVTAVKFLFVHSHFRKVRFILNVYLDEDTTVDWNVIPGHRFCLLQNPGSTVISAIKKCYQELKQRYETRKMKVKDMY